MEDKPHINWQPIETAPKDGTWIDLWVVCPILGSFRAINHHWSPFEGAWIDEHDQFDIDEKYTHWKPITTPKP